MSHISEAMNSRKNILRKLDQQIKRMQREREERMIIARREDGEENEYNLTRKEEKNIYSQILRECFSHYEKERRRYWFKENEKREKKMVIACDYIFCLIEEYVTGVTPKCCQEYETMPFPQFGRNDAGVTQPSW